jgi:nucleoside-diphosphate-sugar epimerase
MTPSASSRAIVTGASGFVGRHLLERLGSGARSLSLGATDWRARVAAEQWKDASVYHLAARVHEAGSAEADYEHDNVEKTRVLAEAAAAGGARRLVFLSSIKVNGEETGAQPFRREDVPAPADAYGRSKWRAEQVLLETGKRAGLEVVIVRSPLVVGPGARGNLGALLRIAASRMPLPFASLRNRRTFIGVRDLATLLLACGNGPGCAGGTFLAGDPRPLSTAALVGAIRAGWNRPAGLFRMSPAVLEAAGALLFAGEKVRRLTRSLEVDVSATLRELAWAPSQPIEAAIAEMARAYRGEAAR